MCTRYVDILKKALLSLSLMVGLGSLTILFQNCAPGFKVASFDGTFSSEGIANFAAAKSVLDSKCLTCHSAGGTAAYAPLNFSSSDAFVTAGLIVAGDPSKSKLIYRLKNYPVGSTATRNMPVGGTLTTEEYQTLLDWVVRMPTGNGPFACSDATPLASRVIPNHAQRLSSTQYRQTITDLFLRTGLTNDVQSVVTTAFNSNPLPADFSKFKRWDNGLDPQHLKSYSGIADTIANAFTGNSTRLNALLSTFINFDRGTCVFTDAASLSTVCKTQFVRNFGMRALRRPIDEAGGELTALMSEFSGKPIELAMNDLVFRFLLDPNFLFKLETSESYYSGSADLLQLSSYSVANRLSYTFWNSMPDETLLMYARTTDLSQTQAFTTALNYTFAKAEQSRRPVREFMNDWLRLEQIPQLQSTAVTPIYANGVTINSTLRSEMIEEVKDLGSFVFDSQGSYEDIFTTDASFARSSNFMKIYGVTAASPVNPTAQNVVRMPAGTHSGLLTRAAMMLSPAGNGGQNPVLRGAKIRETILCMHNEPPPPEVTAGLTSPPFNENMTVRQRYHEKTSSVSCNSCHKSINPIGFALSNFNGFGIYQKSEPAFAADGSYANKVLPVDATADLSDVFGPGVRVSTPNELSAVIAKRNEARLCFTNAYAQYTLGRSPDPQVDGCRLNKVYNAASSGIPLKDLWRSLALDPEFRVRKLK